MSGWHHSMPQWRVLLPNQSYSATRLNQHWGCSFSPSQWQKYWRKLWTCRGHPGARLLIWRVIQHGYYTNARGAVWTVCTNICPICLWDGENTQHLFFECPRLASRWDELLQIIAHTCLDFCMGNSLFQKITTIIQWHRCSPIILIVSSWISIFHMVGQKSLCV